MSSIHFFHNVIKYTPSEMVKRFLLYSHAIGYYICKPTYSLTRTQNMSYDYQIKLVFKGRGHLVWRGKTYDLQQGDIFFLDLSHAHKYYSDPEDPWELYWVHFGGIQSKSYYSSIGSFDEPVFRPNDLNRMNERFLQLFELLSHRPIGFDFRVSVILTEMLTDLAMTRIAPPPLTGNADDKFSSARHANAIAVHDAVEYIEKQFQSQITVHDVCAHVNLSRSHFSRIFKKQTGYSIVEYLNKFRLTQAKYLLVNSTLQVSQIAVQVGFVDQSYFSKTFKMYEHMTPLQYRSLSSGPGLSYCLR